MFSPQNLSIRFSIFILSFLVKGFSWFSIFFTNYLRLFFNFFLGIAISSYTPHYQNFPYGIKLILYNIVSIFPYINWLNYIIWENSTNLEKNTWATINTSSLVGLNWSSNVPRSDPYRVIWAIYNPRRLFMLVHIKGKHILQYTTPYLIGHGHKSLS